MCLPFLALFHAYDLAHFFLYFCFREVYNFLITKNRGISSDMAKKIKKRAPVHKKKSVMQEGERTAVFAATFIIVVVDLLLFIAVFPMLDDIITPAEGSGGTVVLKTIIITVVDIALFVSVFLIVSRRWRRNRKR